MCYALYEDRAGVLADVRLLAADEALRMAQGEVRVVTVVTGRDDVRWPPIGGFRWCPFTLKLRPRLCSGKAGVNPV